MCMAKGHKRHQFYAHTRISLLSCTPGSLHVMLSIDL